MSVEAFAVSYDKANYHAPIEQGHDRESVLKTREKRIEDNILRYLGEYRLGVKFDEIFYREEKDLTTGELYFASGKEEGAIRNIFRKAISTREQKGLSVKREVAECIGFEKLERKLLQSEDNSLFIWVSPPGPRSDGYGDYSFTFVGQKIKDAIRVIPYRNILSLEEHKAYLVSFDSIANNFNSDTDFLANPVVISQRGSVRSPEDILRVIGEREEFAVSWILRLKREIDPLINRYTNLVKIGASDEELTKVKYTIENYTISIKRTLGGNVAGANEGLVLNLDKTIEEWGRYAPPKAAGSCGSTLMEYHEGSNKSWEYHPGDCVVCGGKGVDVGPCNICKGCEKKFDKQEGGGRI